MYSTLDEDEDEDGPLAGHLSGGSSVEPIVECPRYDSILEQEIQLGSDVG